MSSRSATRIDDAPLAREPIAGAFDARSGPDGSARAAACELQIPAGMDLHPQPFYVHELKPVPRDEWPPRAATPTVPVLGTVEVRTKANLRIKPTSCPVVVIATPLDNAPARFAWERPTSEIAQATGGPQVHCPAKPKAR